MDENEWLMATDPGPMLEFLRATGKLSERKARLFAAAMCKRIWPLLTDERSRLAVEVAERFADGLASEYELTVAYQAAEDAAHDRARGVSHARADAANAAASAACLTRAYVAAADDARNAVAGAASEDQATSDESAPVRAWIRAKDAEKRAQADLARCMFGNPTVARRRMEAAWLRWNDGTVLRIATGIYEERAFDRMGVLADALLDAGCDDEDLIAHCRSAGPHVRGCWAVDLILGKE